MGKWIRRRIKERKEERRRGRVVNVNLKQVNARIWLRGRTNSS